MVEVRGGPRLNRNALLVLLALVAGGAGWWLSSRSRIDLPPVDWTGAAPGVRAAYDRARQALEDDPKNPGRWGDLGAVLDVNGLQADAVPLYERAVEGRPWPFAYHLGICLRISDLAGATAALQAAQGAQPENVPVLCALGDALERNDQFEEARHAYARALTLRPDTVPALVGLARVLRTAGDLETARDLAQQAAGLEPQFAPAWRILALLRESQNDEKGAEEARVRGEQGSESWPLHDPVRQDLMATHGVLEEHRRLRARAALEAGRPEDAFAEWEQHLAVAPDSSRAHLELGRLRLRGGARADADEHFRRAKETATHPAEAEFSHGVALSELGDLDGAALHLEQARAADPGHTGCAVQLGVVRLRQGRSDEGLALLRSAVKRAPHDDDALFNLSVALCDSGQDREALPHLETLAERLPRQRVVYPAFHDLHARVLQAAGQERAALAVAEAGSALDPKNPLSASRLAWLLSTAQDGTLRNGPRALGAARSLHEALGATDPRYAVTFAAALAETGDFSSAQNILERAISIAQQQGARSPWVLVLRKHQDHYRGGRPWRGPP